MTIENLVEVVPPPAVPFEAFNGPWEPLEAELGTTLPQDYKDFVRLYGLGDFMEFLRIHIPRSWNHKVRLEWQVHIPRSGCLLFRDGSVYFPWPDPDGLLVFGRTDNSDYLFWHTIGPPDDWGVVVWDGWNFEILDCDLTDFLAGLATGKIVPETFPADLPSCERLFAPDTPQGRRIGMGLWPVDAGGRTMAVSLAWRFGGFPGLSGIARCKLRADG